MRDPPSEDAPKSNRKRTPSKKVLSLVNEILSLSLIEAADLCDLCQEGLQSSLPDSLLPGRTPFPHPGGMFTGCGPGMYPPMGAMVPPPMGFHPGMMPAGMGGQQSQQPAAAATEEVSQQEEKAPPPPPKTEKSVFHLKLAGFDSAKKIAVVKEVRSILGLGLKEAKDLVESAPKIIKKDVEKEEANKLKDRLEAVGGEIVLE